MLPRSPLTLRTVVQALVSLALPILPLAAGDADAQRQPSTASADAGDYRLTMPMLRKALPVLYAPGAKAECAESEEEYRDVRAMSVAEMEKLLDECPPIRRAAAAQGISLRELALVYKALTLAGYRMASEESAKVSGGTAAPLPPGALRDNVALLRDNDAELARLSGDSQ
jgi:hypothetical protein